MSKDAKVTYSKGNTTFKAKVLRLSSQRNQWGSYCYALIEHNLPEDANILGTDGRQVFYSPKLVGEQGKEIAVDLAVIPQASTKTGKVKNQIVFSRSEQEKKTTEDLERKAQLLRQRARVFGVSSAKAGEMALSRIMDDILGVAAPAESDEVASQ